MPDRYTLSDLQQAGVDWVQIACRTYPRAGRYRLRTLIEQFGPKCEDWIALVSADCPQRAETRDWYNRCQANSPTLVEVFYPQGCRGGT